MILWNGMFSYMCLLYFCVSKNMKQYFFNPLSARKWLVLDLRYREAEWNTKKHGSQSS